MSSRPSLQALISGVEPRRACGADSWSCGAGRDLAQPARCWDDPYLGLTGPDGSAGSGLRPAGQGRWPPPDTGARALH